jgi:hypothetical protein
MANAIGAATRSPPQDHRRGKGSNGNLGQDMSPDATGRAFAVTG